MKPEEFDTQAANNQLKEWGGQMDVLAERHKDAVLAATQIAMELEAVQAKYRTLLQQLHELELHANGSYMWENIGDGG